MVAQDLGLHANTATEPPPPPHPSAVLVPVSTLDATVPDYHCRNFGSLKRLLIGCDGTAQAVVSELGSEARQPRTSP